MQRMLQTMVSPGPHLWVVSQVQKFKRLYLSFSTLVSSLKCSIPAEFRSHIFEGKTISLVKKACTWSWSATPPSSILDFSFLVDLLGEHYAEKCHKQWLALGLISELVPQVQISKIIPLILGTQHQQTLHINPTSSVFEIKLNILYSLNQLYIEWKNLSWKIFRYSILGKLFCADLARFTYTY